MLSKALMKEVDLDTVDVAKVGDEQFNINNTFETFVIGPGNRFPHRCKFSCSRSTGPSI